ncbi:MAG TPA: hypothetical protein VGL48_15375 [Acidimicrobiales bacterium]|jgi:hypothetical protein
MAKKSTDKPKRPAAPKPRAEHWKDEPEAHDFPAAADFLSLVVSAQDVKRLVSALKAAPVQRRKAKDLLRASALALLPTDNAHVVADLNKVRQGDALSPVLLVRGDLRRSAPMVIADGYHRVCASYHLDENADIPCFVADLGSAPSRRASSSRGPSTVR